jgi:hypothetical protein
MSDFSNHRKWREFVTAVHESVTYPCAVTYPKVIGALRSGRDWFNDGAARASSWLSGSVSTRRPTISLERALNLEQIET